MERRRGALPVGNNVGNSVPNYLQQQTSFGSTDSTDSNESFRTQVPLAYHLPQDHPCNNDFSIDSGNYYGHQSGSSGKSSLNPISPPYIPQGNTPVMPSAAFGTQVWGSPYMTDSHNGSMATTSSYHQRQGQQTASHYQTGSQFQQQVQIQQQPQMQLGGDVDGMNPQGQSQFGNSGPYGHFSSGGVPLTPGNFNSYSDVNAQIGYTPYATPETSYAAVGQNQYGYSGVVPQSVNSMYQSPNPGNSNFQSGRNPLYNTPSTASASFVSTPRNMNSIQNGLNFGFAGMQNDQNGSSSFRSAPNNVYNGQLYSSLSSKSKSRKSSRPGSVQSNTSSVRQQNKGFATCNEKERNNIYRGAAQRSSNSSTPNFGRPAQAPSGSVRVLSPELAISKCSTPESSRTRKNAIDDTSTVPTPVSKSHTSDTEFTSAQSHSHTKTPQLRSRRGQTIASTSETSRKQSISNWASRVQNPSDNSGMNDQEMKRRGSPIMALSRFTINEPDTLTSSGVISNPFTCMTPGLFTGHWGLGPMSDELAALTQGGTRNPTLMDGIDPCNVPFTEYCRQAKSDSFGVIKISNIPYGVSRAEVLAFLGRNARCISESEYEPIHIIMERVTSKTLECFVEFPNLSEAVSAVNRFETNRMGGRGGRLGQRHVEIELSSQSVLMKELFPKAKNVRWDGSRPVIINRDPNDIYNSGFQGFVSKEELVMLVKHVESPQRSPFSKDCPQRPFECLVDTLTKYPWYMVDHITIDDRNMLHDTTKTLLEILVDRVNCLEDRDVNLSPMLLKRVWRAALRCPGFSPSMKDDIVCIASVNAETAFELGLAPHASYWNKLWTLGPKPGVPVDLILWYAAKIRQASVTRSQLSLAEQAEKGPEEPKLEKLFGDLDKHINYGPGLGQMTLAQVAKIEWVALENILRRAFTPALLPPN